MIAIQPCALLLLVGPDWRVETVSANVAMLGDHRPASVVGQPLADLIGSKAIHTLRNRLSWLSSDESEVQDFGVQWGDVSLDIRATRHGDSHLIEAELAVEPRLPDGIGMVRSMSDRLDGGNPAAIARQAIIQLGAVTGFERLLLVDRQGMLVASNREAGPALSLSPVDNVRLIADREAEAVPLAGDEGNAVLSRAAYLALDSEQRASLEQSGFAASMALPLRIDGQPVATLYAFNSSPRRCSAERRSVAHLFAERLVARMARLGWAEYPLSP
jgi:light-regulated signal transduction histidine kinase (bacteriophytochrome)